MSMPGRIFVPTLWNDRRIATVSMLAAPRATHICCGGGSTITLIVHAQEGNSMNPADVFYMAVLSGVLWWAYGVLKPYL